MTPATVLRRAAARVRDHGETVAMAIAMVAPHHVHRARATRALGRLPSYRSPRGYAVRMACAMEAAADAWDRDHPQP